MIAAVVPAFQTFLH